MIKLGRLDGDADDWRHDMDTGREIRTDELIINVALTGCVHYQSQNPALPVTPEEIGADARRCADEGASIFHLHARDNWGNPTTAHNRIQETVDAVRAAVPGAVVCVSCSGRHVNEYVMRSEGLLISPRPEMASLTLGSYNAFKETIVNNPSTIAALAWAMRTRGILPELECFELGHIFYAHHLITKDELQPPYWFNLFLGNQGTMAALRGMLVWMVGCLPAGALWAGAGIGRHQYEANKWAVEFGGQVRVGLEDSLWMDPDKEDRATNPRQVQRIVAYGQEWGREPTSIERTREILGLEAI